MDAPAAQAADTKAVESGVGTYGSRGTVTAGNAAALAAAKLIGEARSRAASRWRVAEDEVKYANGELSARGSSVKPPRPMVCAAYSFSKTLRCVTVRGFR